MTDAQIHTPGDDDSNWPTGNQAFDFIAAPVLQS